MNMNGIYNVHMPLNSTKPEILQDQLNNMIYRQICQSVCNHFIINRSLGIYGLINYIGGFYE